MMPMKPNLYLYLLLTVTCGAATAQAPPPASTAPTGTVSPPAAAGSKDCAPTQPTPQPGTVIPEGTTTGQSREPLGDKLAKSDGVLCPPSGVDPEIRAPTPDTGNTPVIPPPGSPGGDPSVRPK
jgi:hypothetical protein